MSLAASPRFQSRTRPGRTCHQSPAAVGSRSASGRLGAMPCISGRIWRGQRRRRACAIRIWAGCSDGWIRLVWLCSRAASECLFSEETDPCCLTWAVFIVTGCPYCPLTQPRVWDLGGPGHCPTAGSPSEPAAGREGNATSRVAPCHSLHLHEHRRPRRGGTGWDPPAPTCVAQSGNPLRRGPLCLCFLVEIQGELPPLLPRHWNVVPLLRDGGDCGRPWGALGKRFISKGLAEMIRKSRFQRTCSGSPTSLRENFFFFGLIWQ